MQFETIRAAAVAVKKAILDGRKNWAVYYEEPTEFLHVSPTFKGLSTNVVPLADVSEFLEEAETFCDNMPYCPPALEYLRGFDADEAPEVFVDLLRELLEEAGGVVDDF
jgi:hypothetical protein